MTDRAWRLLFAAAFVALAGCTFEGPPLGPASDVRPRIATRGTDAPTVHVIFRRSPDDDSGRDIVSGYQLLRAEGDGERAPVASEKLEGVELPDRHAGLVDASALRGRAYRYWVVANAESDVSTTSSVGGPSTVSRPSPLIEIPGARETAARLRPPVVLGLTVPDASDGRGLNLKFRISPDDDGLTVAEYRLYRALPNGEFEPFAHKRIDPGPADGARERTVLVKVFRPAAYRFQLWAVPRRGEPVRAQSATAARGVSASWFNSSHTYLLVLVLLTVALTLVYLWLASQPGAKLFIRRIPGIDAIEEAVGRATEMGRPILYVPGIDEIQNIQTIASVLILGRIAETVAKYDTEIQVPCCIPLVAAIGEDVVRQGFYNAGRPDSHKPQNIQWISSEQFAFCAGTNGIMLREKPATNIFLGRFFAESLILAETGYVNRAIQIAGTAEITQLPFFIAACDYTLIGEELFAVSAYMSHEPKLLATLKAADFVKVVVIATIIVGAILSGVAAKQDITKSFLKFIAPGAE